MDSQKRSRAADSIDYPSKRSRSNDMVLNRRLHCVIEGESVVFTVTVGRNIKVGDLKEVIQSKRTLGTLKNVGPHILELWKPNDSNPIFAKPSNNLVERIRSLGDLSQFSNNLEPTDNLFSIFPNQPSNDHIHIIVKIPDIPKRKWDDAYEATTIAMSETSVLASRRLRCIIEGESIVFSVTLRCDCVVSELKNVIQSKRALDTLKNVDPHILELWKVNINLENFYDEDSLGYLKLEENGEGVEKLISWKSIGEYWSDQPPTTYLHIIVKVPATPIPQKRMLSEPLERLMDDFHSKDLVHGDLRAANIICKRDSVMLIDFDWGGKYGEVFYPTPMVGHLMT